MASGPPTRFTLDVDGHRYELGEAEFAGLLYDVVTTLIFEKRVDRATYVLATGEGELAGSGSAHFDPISVSLYRYLKVWRCHGPAYPDLQGEAHSFRLHSIKDGLVAVAFFVKAGEAVPHLTVGTAEADVLAVMERGARSTLTVGDPQLRSSLTRLVTR